MVLYLLYGAAVLLAGFAVNVTFLGRPEFHQGLHFLYVVVVATLVVRLRVALDREKALARTDVLTGVPNRRTFLEAARAQVRRMGREPAPCTVVYLDIDGFKGINDRYGHSVGDAVLAGVARCLSDNVRSGDTVARLGGDEFAVILDGEEAEPVIARLREALRNLARDRKWDVGFSIGAVTFRRPPASAEEMLRRTDAAMYDAKARGDVLVHRVAG